MSKKKNYFPKSEYEKLGINMNDYPSDKDSYDYIKFPIESTKEWQKAHKTKKEKKVAKYEKDLLSKITAVPLRSEDFKIIS